MKNICWSEFPMELDDGTIYRKSLYLMVKTHGFPVKIFPTKPIHWFPSSFIIFQWFWMISIDLKSSFRLGMCHSVVHPCADLLFSCVCCSLLNEQMGVSINGGKMDDLGVPVFQEIFIWTKGSCQPEWECDQTLYHWQKWNKINNRVDSTGRANNNDDKSAKPARFCQLQTCRFHLKMGFYNFHFLHVDISRPDIFKCCRVFKIVHDIIKIPIKLFPRYKYRIHMIFPHHIPIKSMAISGT